MAKLLLGKEVTAAMNEKLQARVAALKEKGVSLEKTSENFWYIELGGNVDTIAEAETLNRRLLALCLGVWDTIKNSGEFNAENFDLEFLGFLPAIALALAIMYAPWAAGEWHTRKHYPPHKKP